MFRFSSYRSQIKYSSVNTSIVKNHFQPSFSTLRNFSSLNPKNVKQEGPLVYIDPELFGENPEYIVYEGKKHTRSSQLLIMASSVIGFGFFMQYMTSENEWEEQNALIFSCQSLATCCFQLAKARYTIKQISLLDHTKTLKKEKNIILIKLMKWGGFSEKNVYVKNTDFKGVHYPMKFFQVPVLRLAHDKKRRQYLLKGDCIVNELILRQILLGIPYEIKPKGMHKNFSNKVKKSFDMKA